MIGPQLPYPDAQNPLCGACGNETDYDCTVGRICDGCQLLYEEIFGDEEWGRAKRLDPHLPVCGHGCDQEACGRFEDDPVDYTWTCYPCQLAAGHTSDHWHGCGWVAS